MQTVAGVLVVARHAFAQTFAGRRGLGLGLLAVVPLATAWLFARFSAAPGGESFLWNTLIVLHQFVVPLAGLFLGVGALGEEIDNRTVTYLFTRPLPRPAILAGRWIGSVVAFAVLLAASVLLAGWLFAERAALAPRQVLGTAGIACAGLAVYAAFFAALRAVLRRALFVGFLLGFIVEGVLSKMPATRISSWSVWHHLAVLQVRLLDVRPRFLGRGLDDLLRGVAPEETGARSLAVLGALALLSLAFAAWIVKTREVRVPAAVA